ncbi:hypothetical protein ACLOJK_009294 [Asimina triloba]
MVNEQDSGEESSYLQQTEADELLVFGNEDDVDGVGGGEEEINGGNGCGATLPWELNGLGNGSNGSNGNGDYLNLSCEDVAQLEWLSTFIEDSFSANMGIVEHLTNSSRSSSSNSNLVDNSCSIKDSHFQTSSPDSVLESSSASSGKLFPLGPNTVVPGRARSKRPRPACFSPRPLALISPTSSENCDTGLQLSSPDSPSESESKANRKVFIKKRKLQQQQHHADIQVRKCLHCGIQKTPQWRAGPMGPKTLCNACGVRYKSGRLFPEYRPAASPTFVPSVHSNSHKKVLEMRVKSGDKTPAPVPEFVRKTSHLLECN